MPELPELEVVREVLNRRLPGQTIAWAEVIPPGGPIVIRALIGKCCPLRPGWRRVKKTFSAAGISWSAFFVFRPGTRVHPRRRLTSLPP